MNYNNWLIPFFKQGCKYNEFNLYISLLAFEFT